jgi:hypothetical protein
MLLEKGMVIYCSRMYSENYMKCIIDRVTERRAFCGDVCFDRDIKNERCFYARGAVVGYHRSSYYLETPKIKEDYHRQCLTERFRRINPDALNMTQLETIIRIVKGDEE